MRSCRRRAPGRQTPVHEEREGHRVAVRAGAVARQRRDGAQRAGLGVAVVLPPGVPRIRVRRPCRCARPPPARPKRAGCGSAAMLAQQADHLARRGRVGPREPRAVDDPRGDPERRQRPSGPPRAPAAVLPARAEPRAEDLDERLGDSSCPTGRSCGRDDRATAAGDAHAASGAAPCGAMPARADGRPSRRALERPVERLRGEQRRARLEVRRARPVRPAVEAEARSAGRRRPEAIARRRRPAAARRTPTRRRSPGR